MVYLWYLFGRFMLCPYFLDLFVVFDFIPWRECLDANGQWDSHGWTPCSMAFHTLCSNMSLIILGEVEPQIRYYICILYVAHLQIPASTSGYHHRWTQKSSSQQDTAGIRMSLPHHARATNITHGEIKIARRESSRVAEWSWTTKADSNVF